MFTVPGTVYRTLLTRRTLLATTATMALSGCAVGTPTAVARHSLTEHDPPEMVMAGPWQYFTPEEAVAVEALVDRLIPPDPETPGGKGAGCAVFIDRQLAGSYGSAERLFMRPPFMDGTPQQGAQSPLTPAARYRLALAALDRYCHSAAAGKSYAGLPNALQDEILSGLESGRLQLAGTSGRAFFELLLKDTQQGFFADPIYGGNRDMAAWKMIGFPGARYDFRDWVGRHNEPYTQPPVSIKGRAAWSQ